MSVTGISSGPGAFLHFLSLATALLISDFAGLSQLVRDLCPLAVYLVDFPVLVY
jgi:hypothetical protein